jgi:glutathionyl-hydroquinone reductase
MTTTSTGQLAAETRDGRFVRQADAFTDRITADGSSGFKADFDHIKRHYCATHDRINPTRIVPKGPAVDWRSAHGRDPRD